MNADKHGCFIEDKRFRILAYQAALLMVKLAMDLNSNNLSNTVIPACFWLD